MTSERIAELLRPFLGRERLGAAELRQVELHLELLLKWNSKTNLTAVRDPEEAIRRHFGESLFAARHLFPRADHGSSAASGSSAIDIGSGAGFPGIPLKVWEPGLLLTLIESNQKKAVFLKEVARALGLANVRILCERAEAVADGRLPPVDLVIFRAVERFEQTLSIALRLVKPQGRLALLIGASQERIAKSATTSVRWNPPLPVPESSSRILLVGEVSH